MNTETHQGITSNPGEGDIHQGLIAKLKEITDKWAMAAERAIKAIEQIAEQTVPSEVDSLEVQRLHPAIAGEVQATGKIKVFAIDDHDDFRQRLRLLISQTDDIELIGESGFLEDIVVIIEQLAPDIVIMDIKLPLLSGLDLAQRVRQRSPGISLIMLTPYENNRHILLCLQTGVAGYLTRDVTGERLASAIQRVFKGEHIINEFFIKRMGHWINEG